MLLAYMYCHGCDSEYPELCLLADKIDAFSSPVKVSSLRETNAAVCRLGPEESIIVSFDNTDGGLVVSPLFPANIYLTPNLPTFPGTVAKKIKIFLNEGKDDYVVYYLTDNDRDNTWKLWIPDREKRNVENHEQSENEETA